MSEISKKSQELATKLWAIANDLRGSMDSSKFKDYILGIIFYRYLSERTENYVNEILENDGITYKEAFDNEDYKEIVKVWQIDHLGYIIKPENLFESLVEKIKDGTFEIKDLETAIAELTESTLGQESEVAFSGLFDDMNLHDKTLGKEVSDRTEKIGSIMLRVSDIEFDLTDINFDVLGTAYMILIGLFASDAGKKGGEFFTPTCASVLLAKLATIELKTVRSVCDPCAGSGSLLLEVARNTSTHIINHYYGQEYNGSTFNLLRMNLLMHGVPYKQFTVFNDDTLKKDNFGEEKFHVQVANPPYSLKWSSDKKYLSDPRFSGSGVLAPKSYADLAFVEHMVYHMADDGRVACLLPHGVLFRGSAEKKIREYLINTLNCVDAIIGLPEKLFHGTGIPTIVLILRKDRNNSNNPNCKNICFIDASKYYKSGKNMNELTDEDIDRIINAYKDRKDIDKFCHIASMEEIIENDYNLNISRYVDTFEEEPEVDLEDTINKIHDLDKQIEEKTKELNEYLKELGLPLL